MTTREAVFKVGHADKASSSELNEAREKIQQAISDGYVLVNSDKLIKLLASALSKEMTEKVYNELTE